MSEEKAAQLGLRPRARFHTFAVAANDPVIMLTAPIPATTLVLAKSKLSLDDIDLIEINEAFASWCWRGRRSTIPTWTGSTSTGVPSPSGIRPAARGAAVGHPAQRDGTDRRPLRLQTMCEGGGQANATIIERLG